MKDNFVWGFICFIIGFLSYIAGNFAGSFYVIQQTGFSAVAVVFIVLGVIFILGE